RHRGHAALVRLVRAIDVEVPQAGYLGGFSLENASHMLVEEELGVAVDVERLLGLALLAELGTRAVDRGRRGVEQRHFLLLAPVEQAPRVGVVVLHHVAAVALHGVGACALVENRFDASLQSLQNRREGGLVDVVRDVAAHEVVELAALLQVVDGDDLPHAAAVQPGDQPRADESRRAGDDVVAHLPKISCSVTSAVPNLVTLMPPARLAARTAASMLSPAASITASVAMTVSPAPVTSDTS